jgi:hypothetical protein
MEVVIAETLKHLETSPYRERLETAIADFEIYGQLRLLRRRLREEMRRVRRLSAQGKPLEAASVYEKASARELPAAYRTWLFTSAGTLRLGAGDGEGAEKDFREALKHPTCAATIDARLGLAQLAAAKGALEPALHELRAAVDVGSLACRKIAAGREGPFKPLFAAESDLVREEVELLSDQEVGDEPIREEIRAALARAEREKKHVLLHFYGPFCPYVMMMEERLAHPELRKLIAEKFIHLRVDFGSFHRAGTIDRDYGGVFNVYGVPSFYILKPDGETRWIQRCDPEVMGAPHRCYSVEKLVEALRDGLEMEDD